MATRDDIQSILQQMKTSEDAPRPYQEAAATIHEELFEDTNPPREQLLKAIKTLQGNDNTMMASKTWLFSSLQDRFEAMKTEIINMVLQKLPPIAMQQQAMATLETIKDTKGFYTQYRLAAEALLEPINISEMTAEQARDRIAAINTLEDRNAQPQLRVLVETIANDLKVEREQLELRFPGQTNHSLQLNGRGESVSPPTSGPARYPASSTSGPSGPPTTTGGNFFTAPPNKGNGNGRS